MSNPVTETKIERVIESVESLTVAIIANHNATDGSLKKSTFEGVQDARAECKTALRDFLAPVLRTVGA